MIRFCLLILALFVSFNCSLPTCNISYWISLNPNNCTTSPNGTYTGLNSNGNCTLSPENPTKSSYKLTIDPTTNTIKTFTVYNQKGCRPGFELLSTQTPLLFNSCGPLFFKITTTRYVQIGSLVFSCKL